MTKIELTCAGCKQKFLKIKSEYNRQLKRNKHVNFYCTSSCCGKYTASNRITTKLINLNCLYCNNNFLSTTHKRNKKCCNIICAKKYAQTFVDTKNISNSIKKYYSNLPSKQNKCNVCNTCFPYKWNKKTCSIKCKNELLRIKAKSNPKCGGETNYKKYKYNNIWMDSTWEVNIAKWLDSNQIEWKRDRKIHFLWTDIDGSKRRYYPDFYLPKYNIYLDPKNKYKLQLDDFKLKKVILENKIKLIYGSQIDIINKLKCICSEKPQI